MKFLKFQTSQFFLITFSPQKFNNKIFNPKVSIPKVSIQKVSTPIIETTKLFNPHSFNPQHFNHQGLCITGGEVPLTLEGDKMKGRVELCIEFALPCNSTIVWDIVLTVLLNIGSFRVAVCHLIFQNILGPLLQYLNIWRLISVVVSFHLSR